MEQRIDVKGLDQADLLRQLFNHCSPLALALQSIDSSPMTEQEAWSIVEEGGQYLDHLQRHVLKLQFQDGMLDPRNYDRMNGRGKAAAAISQLKAG